ncbi:MAG: helix-turn-helix domain-containing protein [Allomuricauda sp.]|uniref:helix-turn-helix domain-containing protein n=1 Tax=Sinomicrobium oceani TaxID=1150368 RepID=UPI00227A597D|nr:helix-turn-helix domain-containing protein [Sinomicrobium oceani]|tara:strand:+ start:4884 stop:5252 length:369 start_codon:yes stop_codon:yes gene_type:complete
MEVKIIKTKKQYNEYLKRLNEIFDAKKGTPESDEFDLLALVIEKYEEEKYPIEEPHPIEAIKFMMEQNNIDDEQLGEIINSRSRVSELFSGTRKLNLNHIRAIHEKLRIPAEILIKEYQVSA